VKWTIREYDRKLAEDLGAYLGVSPILGSLLLERGFSDPLRADMFLKPKLTNLGDPFRVKNLRRAAVRLIEAVEKKEKVLVFGDYYVDGITSLTLFVNVMRHFGVDPTYFVPRRMDEGYGLSPAALERALQDGKPDLLVALDCGTNAADADSASCMNPRVSPAPKKCPTTLSYSNVVTRRFSSGNSEGTR
jgi:single-stranded-DNA-specific exonuclease